MILKLKDEALFNQAYKVWLDLGNIGTEKKFIDSLGVFDPNCESVLNRVTTLANATDATYPTTHAVSAAIDNLQETLTTIQNTKCVTYVPTLSPLPNFTT